MNGAGIQQAKRALLVKVVTKFYLFWIFILNPFLFISCSFIRFGLIAMSTSLDMALSTMFSFPEPAESMMMTFWSSFKNTLQVIQFLKVVSTPFLFSLFTFISNGSRFGRIGNYWTSPSCLEATNYRWLPPSSFRHHFRRGKSNQNSSVKLFIFTWSIKSYRFPIRMMWSHWFSSWLEKLACLLSVYNYWKINFPLK